MSSAAAAVTFVRYFIPYDGDTEEHPNVFVVKKPMAKLTLGDIQSAFPLPGSYLFRAKQPYNKVHVWLDMSNLSAPVPSFNGVVVLKVSRLSADPGAASAATSVAPPASYSSSSPAPVVSRAAPAPPAVANTSVHSSSGRQQAATADVLGLFDSEPPAPASAATSSVSPPLGIDAASSAGLRGSSTGDIFSLAADSPTVSSAPVRSSAGFGPGDSAGRKAGIATGAVSPAVAPALQPGGAGKGLMGGPARGAAPQLQPTVGRPSSGGAGNILAGDIFNM